MDRLGRYVLFGYKRARLFILSSSSAPLLPLYSIRGPYDMCRRGKGPASPTHKDVSIAKVVEVHIGLHPKQTGLNRGYPSTKSWLCGHLTCPNGLHGGCLHTYLSSSTV